MSFWKSIGSRWFLAPSAITFLTHKNNVRVRGPLLGRPTISAIFLPSSPLPIIISLTFSGIISFSWPSQCPKVRFYLKVIKKNMINNWLHFQFLHYSSLSSCTEWSTHSSITLMTAPSRSLRTIMWSCTSYWTKCWTTDFLWPQNQTSSRSSLSLQISFPMSLTRSQESRSMQIIIF